MAAPRRNIPAILTLLFVTPLVAEYLLGDLPLKLLPALIVLAPAYGGGAVLIRETARRTGRGWPTMLMLGAAYTFIAEGLVTQSLFNHDYLKMHMHLLDHAYLPALGIGGWWTLFMFNLHTFWSMGVSIALVEALFPAEAETPWLGPIGDSVVALIFVLGSAANFGIGFKQNQFVASKAQLLSAAVVSVLLMASASLIPLRRSRTASSRVPSPWITGAIAFVLGMSVLNTPPKWGWAAVGALLLIDAVFLALVTFFSQQTEWTALHTLSLAAGGALSYGIRALTQRPLVGGLLWMRISNIVFLTAAIWLILLAAGRVIRYQKTAYSDQR
ncbi:hypothetical protein [Granulicella arctica]|uniref:Uncharacterized protein n=1 Tax=Granulicella arctica TaxID=940613 RepID=A0A7Y9PF75_9BACT|nr:hypothetical protein [Granulicella arctica]NYF78692.1 hypothetical protein [Granulicella arctica]